MQTGGSPRAPIRCNRRGSTPGSFLNGSRASRTSKTKQNVSETSKIRKKLLFRDFWLFLSVMARFDVLGAGNLLKSFLEVVRFSSTEYEPVASHPSAKCSIVYVFRPPFRPTGSSILTCFVAKRFFDEGSDPPRPIPQDPHRNSAQNDVPASSPSLF